MTGERLDAADDDWRADVVALGGDEPDAQRERRVGDRDLRRRLAQQLVAVREHQRAAAAPGDQRSEHARLTASCWKHEHRPPHAALQRVLDGRDRLLLVGPQRRAPCGSPMLLLLLLPIARVLIAAVPARRRVR